MARALLIASERELFGLDLTEVREVLKAPLLHPVPLAPPGLLGAVNVHETVVPVVALGYLCGRAETACEQVVVLHQSGLALAVSAVHGLSGRALAMPGGLGHSWVREMFVSSRGLAGLIDLPALLRYLEREAVSSRTGPSPGLPERTCGW